MKLNSFVALLLTVFLTACASPALNYTQSDDLSIAQYKTFSVKTLDIKGHNSKTEKVVDIALRDALEKRGLTYSQDNADIEVQYAVGVKSTQAVDLKPVSIGSGVYTSHNVVANTRATIVINIHDTKKNENVWRASGSQTISSDEIPQSAINEEFANILQNFK